MSRKEEIIVAKENRITKIIFLFSVLLVLRSVYAGYLGNYLALDRQGNKLVENMQIMGDASIFFAIGIFFIAIPVILSRSNKLWEHRLYFDYVGLFFIVISLIKVFCGL